MQIDCVEKNPKEQTEQIINGKKVIFPSKGKDDILSFEKQIEISNFLKTNEIAEILRVFPSCIYYNEALIDGERFTTTQYKKGPCDSSNVMLNGIQPAEIQSFLLVDILTYDHQRKEKIIKLLIASCKSLKPHLYKDYYGIDCLTKIFSTDQHIERLEDIKRFSGKFVKIIDEIEFNKRHTDRVATIIPVPLKSI